ncbi:MAG TPA: hypothetical protein VHD62_06265, partial [Opitutaceae bacterium]|nr:hypothetical protein [Opitutaceae bacterium]
EVQHFHAHIASFHGQGVLDSLQMRFGQLHPSGLHFPFNLAIVLTGPRTKQQLSAADDAVVMGVRVVPRGQTNPISAATNFGKTG